MSTTVRVSVVRWFEHAKRWVQVDPARRKQYVAHLAFARAVAPEIAAQAGWLQRLYDWRNRNRLLEVDLDTIEELAVELEEARPRQLAAALVEPGPSVAVTRVLVPRGDASRGEIEVTSWSSDDLLRPASDPTAFEPASHYVAVYVDRVRFRGADDAGGVHVAEGKYVRIDVPRHEDRGDGAVVLAVDRTSGDALLTVVYRHPQRRFLTEAVRGFGLVGVDASAVDTARRELLEETGARPLRRDPGALWCLRSLYTDTGKLCERPSFFLAIVDRDEQEVRLARARPALENPVWVPLRAFYRALRDEAGVVLGPDEHRFAYEVGARRAAFDDPTDDAGRFRLVVEDGFTTNAGFLAEPRLRAMFPSAFDGA